MIEIHKHTHTEIMGKKVNWNNIYRKNEMYNFQIMAIGRNGARLFFFLLLVGICFYFFFEYVLISII